MCDNSDEKTLEKTNISFMLIELTKSDKFKKFIFSRGSDNPYHEGFLPVFPSLFLMLFSLIFLYFRLTTLDSILLLKYCQSLYPSSIIYNDKNIV
jgi:hypothetical protein